MKNDIKIEEVKKNNTLTTTAIGLGLGLVVLSGGYIGTHEKFGENWLSKEDYNKLKNSLIEKQKNNGYITIEEWKIMVAIYDKELKSGILKKKFKNINKNNLVENLNNHIKAK